MAEDVIISALIKAGIEIDPKDVAALRTKLLGIGEALGEGGLDSLEAHAKKLIALRAQINKDSKLLDRVARRPDGGAGLTGKERASAKEATARLQTYQTELKKVANTLNSLGIKTGLPVFKEITQLNQAFQHLADTLRNLKPLVSQITQEKKAADLAEKKAQTKKNRAARIETQRAGIETSRTLRGVENKRGKELYTKGVKSQFLNVADSKEAAQVAKYAKAEAARSEKLLKIAEAEHGAKSRLAEKPRREAMLAAQAVDAANQRVEALKSTEAADKRDRSAAATLRAAEEKIAINRTTRANRERSGASAFVQAGGINGSVGNYTDLTKSQQALKFVNGELSDSAAHLKALTTAYGANHPRVLAAAAENKKLAAYYHDLAQQIDAVTAAKKKQDATTRAETAQRNQEHKEAIALNKSLDAAAAKDKRTRDQLDRRNPTGKDALLAAGGVGSSFTNLDHLGKAKALRSYLDAQLKNTNRLQEVYSKTLGENSQQSQAATAQANRYADALARVDAQLEVLKSKRALSSRQAGKSGAFTEGRKIYESVRNTPDGLANLEGADKGAARSYLSARKTESLSRYQQLATDFGANSRQAKAAAAAVQQYDTALAQMNRTVGVSHASIGGLATVFKTFLKYAVLYQAMYGVINAVRALVTSITDLQAEMLEIQAVTASTNDQMQQLGAAVQGVAKNSKFSLAELTEAAKVLAQAGIPISELNTSLQATANFAAATGTNLQTAADLLSTTRSVFKELSDDTLSNQLAKAINISKLTGEDLKTILSLGAQTAESFNLSSEQFLSAVATLRNAGLKSSTVATGLRQGMLEIFTPDHTLTKALQVRYRELGENLGDEAVKERFFQFTNAKNPLIAALSELKRLGFADEGQQLLSRAFDVRSTNAIKALINNLDQISANESRITFGRAAADGARITMDGLNASLTRLNSTITGTISDESQGLLGWLSNVVQGTDEAIQRFREMRSARQAVYGLTEEEADKSAFGGPGTKEENEPGPIAKTVAFAARNSVLRLTYGKYLSNLLLTGSVNEPDPEKAEEERLKGARDIISAKALQRSKYANEASAYDIRAAEAGDTSGLAANSIVAAKESSERLNLMVSALFGEELVQDNQQLVDLLNGYTSATASLREPLLKALQAKYPALSAEGTSGDQLLFELDGLVKARDGALTAMREQLNLALVLAQQNIEKLGDKAPTTAADFSATVFKDVAIHNFRIQEVLAGTSKATVDEQLKIARDFAQAVADQISNGGGVGLSVEQQIKESAETLGLQAKVIAKQDTPATALPEFTFAIQGVQAEFQGTNKAYIDYFTTLRKLMEEQAKQAVGLEKGLLLKGAELLTAGVQSKVDLETQATEKRVAEGREANAALSNPGFQTTIKSLPITDPRRQQIEPLFNTAVSEDEFRNDTKLSQELLERWREWVTIYNQAQIVKAEVDRRIEEEEQDTAIAAEARDKAGIASAANRFDEARAQIRIAEAAELRIQQRAYQKSVDSVATDTLRGKPKTNDQLIEEQVSALKAQGATKTAADKQVAQLNQEEAKLNNRRATDAAKIEQARLGSLLGAAGMDTPKNVLDETLRLYNENNEELKRLAAEKKVLDGDLSQASREQQYEEDQKLAKYQEQNAYLELVFRQERERRDEIQRLLDVPFTSGNPTEDARLRGLGVEPGTRTKRVAYDTNRAQLVMEQIANAKSLLSQQQKVYAEVGARLEANPGAIENANLVIDQKTRKDNIIALTKQIQDDTVLLGEISQNLVQMHASIFTSVGTGFDIDTLILGLQQAESGVEKLAAKIHDDLISGLEGVGDAFADSLLEGENFFDTLNDLLIDTGKSVLRDIIKTYTTESIVGLLGTISPSFTAEAAGPGAIPSAVGSGGLLSTLGGIIKDGYNYVTGNTPAEAAVAPAVAGVTGEASPFSLVGDLLGGTTDEAGGMCCVGAGEVSPDGLTDLAAKGLGYEPDEAGLGGVLQEATNPTSPVLAEAASEEAGGFFDFLKSGFDSIWGALSDGFGSAMKGIGDILFGSGGSGGGAGAFGMLATVMGFKHGGLIKAATGGVISGRGTGMSDSIPGFIRSKSGKLRPLLTSNGESILNAKATSFLGENGIHALNSGDFMRANTAGMKGDIRAMMGSIRPGNLASPGTPTGGVVKNYKSTQVAVTPSQMRMRMGDWLEQHVIEELGKR